MTADKNESILDSLNDDSVIYTTSIITKETEFEDGSVPVKALDPQVIGMINDLESKIDILSNKITQLTRQLDSKQQLKHGYMNGVEIMHAIENEVK